MCLKQLKKNKIGRCLWLLLILFNIPLLAGNFHVSWDTYVIETKYFDIIYPLQSEQTAQILAQNVDAMYEEIASSLNTEITMHLPVVITPNTQQLNAYFSPMPYNHIVIYDTPPDSSSIAVFSKTVLSIFYNELFHACLLNIRSPVVNFI